MHVFFELVELCRRNWGILCLKDEHFDNRVHKILLHNLVYMQVLDFYVDNFLSICIEEEDVEYMCLYVV